MCLWTYLTLRCGPVPATFFCRCLSSCLLRPATCSCFNGTSRKFFYSSETPFERGKQIKHVSVRITREGLPLYSRAYMSIILNSLLFAHLMSPCVLSPWLYQWGNRLLHTEGCWDGGRNKYSFVSNRLTPCHTHCGLGPVGTHQGYRRSSSLLSNTAMSAGCRGGRKGREGVLGSNRLRAVSKSMDGRREVLHIHARSSETPQGWTCQRRPFNTITRICKC